jgi:hypothetical protein
MCHLVFYAPQVPVDVQHLRNGAEVNDEFHGFAIATPGRMVVAHAPDADWLIRQFRKVRDEHPGSPAIWHSRLSTGSANTLDNAQPLTCGADPQTVVAHNGALPFRDWALADGYSDTRAFAEFVFPLAFADLDDPATFELLEAWSTPANKLAFLTASPRYESQWYLTHRDQWIVTPSGALHSNADFLGRDAGWGEHIDADGDVWRWRQWQPGQCAGCHAFHDGGQHPLPLKSGMPAHRNESERRRQVAAAAR